MVAVVESSLCGCKRRVASSANMLAIRMDKEEVTTVAILTVGLWFVLIDNQQQNVATTERSPKMMLCILNSDQIMGNPTTRSRGTV
mmetsp:Transcript_24826/g.35391  ORF Transcript_24826/g.35391 Transcript_24826/m.35391 type:complete len:86 (+) Transcript_24826:469-726(+)